MTPQGSARPTRHSQKGFTLPELLLAVSLLVLCAILFAAAFPTSTRSRVRADHRSKAVSLAMREMEAIRDAGYTQISTYSSLYSSQLVDSYPSTTPYSCTNVSLNSGQSIANSLPSGTGAVYVTTQSPDMLLVTVTVNWQDVGQAQSVSVSTLIANI